MYHRFGCTAPRLGKQLCKSAKSIPFARNYWKGRLIPVRPGWSGLRHHDAFWGDVGHSLRNFENVIRDTERAVFGPRFQTSMMAKPEEITYNSQKFQVRLDVKDYDPEKLTLKITNDSLLISGKYEQKDAEHGTMSREFARQFTIPQDVEMESLQSTLSEEGVLTINGTVKGSAEPVGRVIDIQRETDSNKSD